MALARQLTSSASLKCKVQVPSPLLLKWERLVARGCLVSESNQLIATNVKRPRNVDVPCAAAILYGDWGKAKPTSSVSPSPLAVARPFHLSPRCVLTAVVGINYIIICRLLPGWGRRLCECAAPLRSHLHRWRVPAHCRLSAAETIVDVAATLGASRAILGAPQRNALLSLIRGSVIREVSNSLPEEIDLLVYA